MRAAKQTGKKKGRKQPKKGSRARLLGAIIVFFVVLSGLLVFLVFGPKDETMQPKSAKFDDTVPPIPYEEASSPDKPVSKEAGGKKIRVALARRVVEVQTDLPSVAIVIDDMGYSEKTCEALLDLDFNLSFAFLPYGPYTAKQAYRANRLGRDVLLHFPMEASDAKWHPGRGTVTIAMESPEIQRTLSENLASVPYAVGINNHMGSRFTQNDRAMRIFLTATRETGLFFLDSRTSANSVGYSLAREMGLRTAKRDIFLDNVRDPQKIIIQLRKLLDAARRDGTAIAIGHPYPETLQALKEYRREILRRAKLVGVAALAR
jgi:hypothetical protein